MSTKLPLAAKWRMPEKNTGNKSSPKSFEEEKQFEKEKQNKQLLNTENKNESSFPYISRLQ